MIHFPEASKIFRSYLPSVKKTLFPGGFSIKSILRGFNQQHPSPTAKTTYSPPNEDVIAVMKERLAAFKSETGADRGPSWWPTDAQPAIDSSTPRSVSPSERPGEKVTDPNLSPQGGETIGRTAQEEAAGTQWRQLEQIRELQPDLNLDQKKPLQENSLEELVEKITALEWTLKTVYARSQTQQEELELLQSLIKTGQYLQTEQAAQHEPAGTKNPIPQDNVQRPTSKAKQSRNPTPKRRLAAQENREQTPLQPAALAS